MTRPALALLALALLPATASADTYCVQKPTCAGMDVPAGLEAALQAASNHAGPDRVEIGATASPISGAFDYYSDDKVDIVGEGVGVTRLTQPVDPSYTPVLILGGHGAAITVSDLSVELPTGAKTRGLRLGPTAIATRVEVKGDAGTHDAIAVALDGGILKDSTVSLPSLENLGVSFDATGARLQDTDVTASYAVRADFVNGSESVRGGRITATDRGIAAEAGTVSVEDVAIDLRGSTGSGLFASDSNNLSGALGIDARHVTVIGDNVNAIGAFTYNTSATETSSIQLRDSVLTGVGRPLVRHATAGTASISTDYSDYPALTNPNESTGPGSLTETNHLTGAAALNPATLVPTAASPLLDAGTPGALGAGERITDAVGKPRFVAATGCDAARDIGAFEFQPAALTAAASAAATAKAGEDVAYSSAGSCDPNPSAALVFSWSFDDGTVATGASPTHAWSTGGTHVATLTVTGGGGRTGTATASVDVTAPPVVVADPSVTPTDTPSVTPTVSPTVAPTVTPGPLDTTVPVLSKLTRRAFTLSEAATVKLTLRRGHHKARHLTVTAAVGKTRFRVRARRPGRYRLTASPTDTAGNHGKTVRLRFRVRR